MVQIVDYKTFKKEDGEKFQTLVIQGGVEAVKSKETGRTYLTARTTNVSCTFNEVMCKSLIGTELDGTIKKIEVDPYDYNIPGTNEFIELNHRYEFVTEEDEILDENVIENEAVL